MKEDGYKIRDQFGVYFISFAVVQCVDVFSRSCYAETVVNSLNYCIKEKGLKVHAWCIMTNHVHLIVSAEKGDLSDILRDFKSFTAKQILKQIEDNKEESRKSCLPPHLWRGCFGFSNNRQKPTAGMILTSFGNSTTNPFNCKLLSLH